MTLFRTTSGLPRASMAPPAPHGLPTELPPNRIRAWSIVPVAPSAKRRLRQSPAAGTLRERADALHAAAEETLTADRKRNTERRARMGAHIDARARGDQAKAKTMHAIADGLEKGELRHLGGIRHGTHIDALDSALRSGKYETMRQAQKAGQHVNYEDHFAAPETEADVAATPYT